VSRINYLFESHRFARFSEVGAGHNKAWLHHVKNHRKFDTLNSFRSVDDCPICQAMDDDEVMLTMRHRYDAGMD
jgi:hypothetical protein